MFILLFIIYLFYCLFINFIIYLHFTLYLSGALSKQGAIYQIIVKNIESSLKGTCDGAYNIY